MRSHGPLGQVTSSKLKCLYKWVNVIIILQPEDLPSINILPFVLLSVDARGVYNMFEEIQS